MDTISRTMQGIRCSGTEEGSMSRESTEHTTCSKRAVQVQHCLTGNTFVFSPSPPLFSPFPSPPLFSLLPFVDMLILPLSADGINWVNEGVVVPLSGKYYDAYGQVVPSFQVNMPLLFYCPLYFLIASPAPSPSPSPSPSPWNLSPRLSSSSLSLAHPLSHPSLLSLPFPSPFNDYYRLTPMAHLRQYGSEEPPTMYQKKKRKKEREEKRREEKKREEKTLNLLWF